MPYRPADNLVERFHEDGTETKPEPTYLVWPTIAWLCFGQP